MAMRNKRPNRETYDSSVWIPMSDMLTNTLLILCLFIAVSTLARAMNPKAPSINLDDSSSYRFASGSFILTNQFRQALRNDALPIIRKTLRCYGSDSIELVGHTDGTPAGDEGNLDQVLPNGLNKNTLGKLSAGSNVDLGLLRALAVKNELEAMLSDQNGELSYRVLSGGSLIGPNGNIQPAKNTSDVSRRRIEIRFYRNSKVPFLPRC